jgi:hypothetical protein
MRLATIFSTVCAGRSASICYQTWSSDNCSGDMGDLSVTNDGYCGDSNIIVADQDLGGFTWFFYDKSDSHCSGQATKVAHYDQTDECQQGGSGYSFVRWISLVGCTDLPARWCCPAVTDCSTCYGGACGNKCYWFPGSYTKCQADNSGSSCPAPAPSLPEEVEVELNHTARSAAALLEN